MLIWDFDYPLQKAIRDYLEVQGLEYRNGEYHYSELWDGGMYQPRHYFDDQSSFAQWLSQQPNASLSNIHLSDAFYWGNQVIIWQRLEQFVPNSIP